MQIFILMISASSMILKNYINYNIITPSQVSHEVRYSSNLGTTIAIETVLTNDIDILWQKIIKLPKLVFIYSNN